jgi:hypothetical protein
MATNKYNFILIASLFLLVSCKKETEEKQNSDAWFSVDLQSDFQNDSVRVTVDNNKVLDKRITTNMSLGLAEIVPCTLTTGTHTIKIEMPEKSIAKDSTVDLQGDFTFAVVYNNSISQLSFQVYHFRLFYD